MAQAPSIGSVRILDGGTGSELRRRGLNLSDRCWSARANLTHPDLLIRIHEDYIRAGAQIITANTFATSRFVLAGAGLEQRFGEINRAAIAAARRAAASAEREIAVAGSISCMPPAFDAGAYPNPDAEYAAYSELAACFVENGIDLILLEMMQDPVHAPRACRAVRAAGRPYWIGISCRLDPVQGRLVAFDDPGQPLAAVLDSVLPFDPAGVAIMHSPIDAIGPAIGEIGAVWKGPIGAYAEIPYVEDPSAGEVDRIDPAAYADAARDWIERGATLVGGCCGTTPAHIEALNALTRP